MKPLIWKHHANQRGWENNNITFELILIGEKSHPNYSSCRWGLEGEGASRMTSMMVRIIRIFEVAWYVAKLSNFQGGFKARFIKHTSSKQGVKF